jgi:hypothetical protein
MQDLFNWSAGTRAKTSAGIFIEKHQHGADAFPTFASEVQR